MNRVSIIWDIDGTLLNTGGVGVAPFQTAIREITGLELDLDRKRFSGLTDFAIAEAMLRAANYRDTSMTVVERVLIRYVQLLEEALERSPAKPIGNISKVLEQCAQSEKFQNYIGTGNFGAGAVAKLQSAGLLKFFDSEVIYAAALISPTREQILSNARDGVPNDSIGIVVGDSPHDVSASRNVGLKVICTPTGQHSWEELSLLEPDGLLAENWNFAALDVCITACLRR